MPDNLSCSSTPMAFLSLQKLEEVSAFCRDSGVKIFAGARCFFLFLSFQTSPPGKRGYGFPLGQTKRTFPFLPESQRTALDYLGRGLIVHLLSPFFFFPVNRSGAWYFLLPWRHWRFFFLGYLRRYSSAPGRAAALSLPFSLLR